jgi:putative aminopeptidase FrvX
MKESNRERRKRRSSMFDRLQMLRELTSAPGVPGYEHKVRPVIARYLNSDVTVSSDRLGSIIAEKRGSSAKPRIMLAGHMDEIGFLIKFIEDDGFLRFQTLGGWWENVMLAQRVTVVTRDVEISGVIGARPPHVLSDEEEKQMAEKRDMFIDIGAASREEASAWGVRPGDFAVPESEFRVMKNPKLLMAKAWDDRIGCAVFIEVLRELSGIEHPNTVYGVGTVLEEIGLRGAQTAAQIIEPDIGIALETTVAGDAPGHNATDSMSHLGKGPAVLIYDHSLVPSVGLREFIIGVASETGIPLQLDIMPGGGTDAARMQVQGAGAPSIVMGVPARYIHSHSGIIHRDDYDMTVRLLVEMMKRLDEDTVSAIRG